MYSSVYEGRSINKLQNGVFWLIFKTSKILTMLRHFLTYLSNDPRKIIWSLPKWACLHKSASVISLRTKSHVHHCV